LCGKIIKNPANTTLVPTKLTTVSLHRPFIDDFRKMDKMKVTIVLDNVRSGLNVGSIFRSCDAFPVERIILLGITPAPPSREVLKTALGATESVEWQSFSAWQDLESSKLLDGYSLIALEQTTHSQQLQSFVPENGTKYALVVGNEVDGVSQEILDHTVYTLEIPQSGTKHSLNVAVAAGIALWHFYHGLMLNTNIGGSPARPG
jgi:tRNA G18 (ribose-2'-O)-methylase SpoU